MRWSDLRDPCDQCRPHRRRTRARDERMELSEELEKARTERDMLRAKNDELVAALKRIRDLSTSFPASEPPSPPQE